MGMLDAPRGQEQKLDINRLDCLTHQSRHPFYKLRGLRLANPPPDRGHEKAPVPDSLAAQGTRAEITGCEQARQQSEYTVPFGLATRPRILGTLHLRVRS
jgi:hypothetical protein